jgi:hypothetical protein
LVEQVAVNTTINKFSTSARYSEAQPGHVTIGVDHRGYVLI